MYIIDVIRFDVPIIIEVAILRSKCDKYDISTIVKIIKTSYNRNYIYIFIKQSRKKSIKVPDYLYTSVGKSGKQCYNNTNNQY